MQQSPPERKTGKNSAVFLDRDGVLNYLEYNPEEGRIGSPLSAKQLRVFSYAGTCVNRIKELGFKAILVSNQPGVAKRQLTLSELQRMNGKVRNELAKQGCALDAEYFCLHHPDALLKKYRFDCDCRKPKPGLLLRAAEENDIDLSKSFFVGDALVDVKAGKAAGCRTILLGHITTFLTSMIEREVARPDFILPSLRQVPDQLRTLTSENAGIHRLR
ncbi:MAG: HAD-IIIA family hydrolase [Thaumarchaeota archaeon]|nr:HAD-IIIA family hydrolase [Nitrososphaerota archaeon]